MRPRVEVHHSARRVKPGKKTRELTPRLGVPKPLSRSGNLVPSCGGSVFPVKTGHMDTGLDELRGYWPRARKKIGVKPTLGHQNGTAARYLLGPSHCACLIRDYNDVLKKHLFPDLASEGAVTEFSKPFLEYLGRELLGASTTGRGTETPTFEFLDTSRERVGVLLMEEHAGLPVYHSLQGAALSVSEDGGAAGHSLKRSETEVLNSGEEKRFSMRIIFVKLVFGDATHELNGRARHSSQPLFLLTARAGHDELSAQLITSLDREINALEPTKRERMK